ncbi:MAG: nucleotide exchange factor GrpE [Patescibacteria group bacterium]|nr:nucleotide exchange factor GrpE [Patescibacteria group bacterium]
MTQKDPKQDLQEIKLELARIREEHETLKDTAMRAAADLQNFKRRIQEEQADLRIFANVQLLEALFPIIDNLKRAFQSLPENLAENEWVKGIESIEKQLIDTLTQLGLEEIKTIGEQLNPELHEAVLQGPGPKDEITEELEKGFAFKGKAIKPAKVKVGDGS